MFFQPSPNNSENNSGNESDSFIPLGNSPSLENYETAGPPDVQIATAGPSDIQIATAGPSDVQIAMAGPSDVQMSDVQIATAGPSDVQIAMAGSLRKRMDEEPISKEAKKIKLIKDTIIILLEDHLEVQQFLETISANVLKNGLVALKSIYSSNCKKIVLDIDEQKLTAVLLSGSLYVKSTFYMGEESFIELETNRFRNNPYILQRLPTEVNRNNTIGIDLLFKEKTTDDENIKKEILAVARLIYHLRTVQDRLPENRLMMKPDYNNKKYIQNLQEYYDNYLSKGMEFNISKIKGAISLARNIEQDLNLKIDSLNKIVDDSNMSSVMKDMLTILDEIKSETEIPELSRRRNTRKYAYFYELYMKILEVVASEPKQFGETNASKAKKRLEKEEEESGEEETILGTFIKRAEEKLTQR
ncbi:uncharacterized protein OCT59_008724 [Rhizophagus irregularis]|uniref:Uncharacterized protein n=2 Tax=Rhizophagus irregularis TaxID=588596 RepID=U9SK29_RHIID|nr:hypothetical protein GLOIN_2v1488988 [Rhizophagus irregularis DAOM 181602=DAOM 197198]EXX52548.1 hypothetical protein RirG_252080 [Rhizophagus irregularis DAOM 197198w]UZO17368.1 hypothetical protein OCT59_008724 [Rhizophagus irregularis]POG57929.1 hypothetical protein GLOIN_2v1488988 [Rhizophagus irregularis DAOM 181602=DAOM 197198]CAG8710011.1 8591_t:CDS:2 [Rhizophagus irregularis]GBC29589.1 proline-rich protein 2-like [Rhizophagus irregularis DAOM 181602=DAOM 197198]|eukprot:XP_025164795.1 hypothetical protein GLOIN_2v1488988 [Rhizophagus irregularis DAOM 181602=DAOM 197198]